MPAPSATLSADELQRYHRHIILPGVGEEGQRRLKSARVLIVGAGGLGSPAALYLAAAGVGHIGIVDADLVELSNLQRQIIHTTRDVATPKVDSASDRVRALNPTVDVRTYHLKLTSVNALETMRGYDVIVDGTDNFPARYLISDACVLLGKPNVHGSVSRFDGQASVFSYDDGPCYRCLFPEPPAPGTVQNCAEGGVFGVVPGVIGVIQATEAIKIIVGLGNTLSGRLLMVNALEMAFKSIELERDPDCPACGTHEITSLADYDAFCGEKAGLSPRSGQTEASSQRSEQNEDEITPLELHARILRGDDVAVIDVREPYEWAIARLPHARLVPLNSLPSAVTSLDRDRETVVYCHHGMRSAAAMEWLQDNGFTRVKNLVGGIDRWSVEVDHSLRRY